MKMLNRIIQKRLPFVRTYCSNYCKANDWIYSPFLASLVVGSFTTTIILNEVKRQTYILNKQIETLDNKISKQNEKI